MLTDDGDALCHALTEPNALARIGLRRDSLGSQTGWNWQFPDRLPNCRTPADRALIVDRWRTAPFVTEPFGNGSSPVFPCQTFGTDPATGEFDILEQVQPYHVAAVENGAIRAGVWSGLTAAEQQAFLLAGNQAGYRFVPAEVELSGGRRVAGL